MSTPDASPCKTKREEDKGSLSPDDGLDDGMDEATRQALTDMDDCQKELEELNEKESKEILQVENMYNKIRKPYYAKREGIIEKIPNFWVNSIVNHPQLWMVVDEEEEDCLQFLKKVEVVEFDNVQDGFRIIFIFAENPFFENLELVKEFKLGPNTEPKSTSTTIKWKKNMDLCHNLAQIIEAKKMRGLEPRTFFSWFSSNKNPDSDDIAEVFKDDLWPSPLQYYLAPDMDSDDDEESMKEDGIIDEEDDQESSEDDDGVEDGEEDDGVSEKKRKKEEEDDVSGRKKRKVTGKGEGEGQ